MSDIRWVCLSDTHFGAENSLLSHVRAGETQVDPTRPSPVLRALCACLRVLVETNEDGRRPTLVLNGDALELALASDNVAAMVFEQFVDLAFAPPDPLFDETIVYIPGNHDHHLWETARERQYADYVASVSPGVYLEAPWHVTRLFPIASAKVLEAQLLTALVRRRAGAGLRVRVVYPNMGLADDPGTQSVLLHHGHLVEPLYRLMSLVEAALFPAQAEGVEVWDWEADNFAWIDFFWSTLGRSGSVGQDVGLVYDMLQDPKATGLLAGNLGRFVAEHFSQPLRTLLAPAFGAAARWVGTHAGKRERNHHEVLLSTSARQGLAAYLDGPLRLQLAREREDLVPRPVSFVFGHTHKPFEVLWDFAGFAEPVAVYNTGGWVVDTERTTALHGASVVVIDDDCNIASLRMYNQADSASQYAVRLAGELPGRPSPLRQRLARQLRLDAGPWQAFSTAAAELVEQRHLLLPEIIGRATTLTRPTGGR